MSCWLAGGGSAWRAGVELKLAGTVGYRSACDGRLPPVGRWPGRVGSGGSACSALGREQGSAADDRRTAGTAACSPGDSRAAVRHPRSPRARGPAGCSPRSWQPAWLHAGCHAGRSAGRRRGCEFSAGAGLPLEAPGRSAPRPPAPRSPFLPALTVCFRQNGVPTPQHRKKSVPQPERKAQLWLPRLQHRPSPSRGAPRARRLPAGGSIIRPPLAWLRPGDEIPDGPLTYRSRHEPVPLTELERMLVLSVMGGTTGSTTWSQGRHKEQRNGR